MLALKQGLSLVSAKSIGWSPADESSLEAWYQHKTGLTLEGAGATPDVSAWADTSSNSHDMAQATVSERPVYTPATGILTFTSGNTENLQTTSQISLTGEFTIGIKCTPTQFTNVLLADNTSSNEFFKFTGTTNLRVKIGGSVLNLEAAATFGDDFLILTRDSGNNISLWKNGTREDTGGVLAGTCLIDAIGVRATDLNAYDGIIKEIQIYDSISDGLTAQINTRLQSL